MGAEVNSCASKGRLDGWRPGLPTAIRGAEIIAVHRLRSRCCLLWLLRGKTLKRVVLILLVLSIPALGHAEPRWAPSRVPAPQTRCLIRLLLVRRVLVGLWSGASNFFRQVPSRGSTRFLDRHCSRASWVNGSKNGRSRLTPAVRICARDSQFSSFLSGHPA